MFVLHKSPDEAGSLIPASPNRIATDDSFHSVVFKHLSGNLLQCLSHGFSIYTPSPKVGTYLQILITFVSGKRRGRNIRAVSQQPGSADGLLMNDMI